MLKAKELQSQDRGSLESANFSKVMDALIQSKARGMGQLIN